MMTSSVSIRATPRFARAAEASTVFHILWSCRREIPLKDSFNSKNQLQRIRDQCRSKKLLVVGSGGDIFGVMLLRANEIFYLAVTESYRRRGIARSLIAYAKKRWPKLTAKTREDNARTIALLEKESFYHDPMALVLDPTWKAFAWIQCARRKR